MARPSGSVGVVVHGELVVGGPPGVELDPVRAEHRGLAERLDRVLGAGRRGAPMADDQRRFASRRDICHTKISRKYPLKPEPAPSTV